jgi:hypothetical protein
VCRQHAASSTHNNNNNIIIIHRYKAFRTRTKYDRSNPARSVVYSLLLQYNIMYIVYCFSNCSRRVYIQSIRVRVS